MTNKLNDNTHELKGELSEYQSYGPDNYSIVRKKEEENPNNPFLRSLFLAAFLRCIFALLETPAEIKIKDLMIEKLTEKNNLRDITKFCETCISGRFNIPSKFISIVKFIVLKEGSEQKIEKNDDIEEDFEQVDHNNHDHHENEIVEDKNNIYIANLLKTILTRMKGKLTIEKDDDKILLINICECAKSLITKIDYNHIEIKQIMKNTSHISRKYILSKKLLDYCDIVIIETFLGVIKEYMNLENLYFKKNSKNKDKENEPKNAQNGENNILLDNNDDNINEKNEEIVLLNERCEESNQIKILTIFQNYMETENSEPGAYFKVDEYLLRLISFIPIFLGEYMSRSSMETVSEIFEFFTRSSVFYGVIIRKSYIKEIVFLMNQSKKRKLLSLGHRNQFMSRVDVSDLENKGISWNLLLLLDNEIKLIPIDAQKPEKDDLIDRDKLNKEEEMENEIISEITQFLNDSDEEGCIPYMSISHIFMFEIKNLIILRIQREKPVYKLFFFKRSYIADMICWYIKMNNCNVKILNIPVLINDEEMSKLKEMDNLKEKIGGNEKKINQENFERNFERKVVQDENEENDNNTPGNNNENNTPTPNETPEDNDNKEVKDLEENTKKLIEQNEEEKKNFEKIQEQKQLEDLKKDPNDTVIMYCNIPMSNFLDMFLNLFKSKKEIEEDNLNNLSAMRVLKVNGQKCEIYDEASEGFNNLNPFIFSDDVPINEMTNEIKKCFVLRESIDMSEFTDVEYRLNTVILNFNGKKYEVNCFDDFSLIKLKTCLFIHKMKDISITNKEDYTIIDKKA